MDDILPAIEIEGQSYPVDERVLNLFLNISVERDDYKRAIVSLYHQPLHPDQYEILNPVIEKYKTLMMPSKGDA